MKNLVICFIFCSSCSVSSKIDCNKLPNNFKSYNEAIQIIMKTNFAFTDSVNTYISSWVRSATFYSCDNNFGFFVIEIDKIKYIYENMPIEIWYGFKSASSFGRYFDENIRDKFQLYLKS